jgi:hypothetical protein
VVCRTQRLIKWAEFFAVLMQYLGETYGVEDGEQKWEGEDILWNADNHRLLDDEDFHALSLLNVKPWKFVQNAVRHTRSPSILSSSPVQGISWPHIIFLAVWRWNFHHLARKMVENMTATFLDARTDDTSPRLFGIFRLYQQANFRQKLVLESAHS